MSENVPNKVVEELLKFAKTRLQNGDNQSQLPTKQIAREAIFKALSLIDIPDGSDIDSDLAKFALFEAQKLLGITGNPAVLTVNLAERIISRLRRMDTNDSPSTNKVMTRQVDGDRASDKPYWVRYYVDVESFHSFASPDHVRLLIYEAWQMWIDHLQFLLVREYDRPDVTDKNEDDAEESIITVRAGVVPGDAVGLATVLGPGNFVAPKKEMFVTLDIKDINSPDEYFRTIACHEFGHTIGLGHRAQRGSLMSEIVIRDIMAPTKLDVMDAQRIYGAAQPIPEPLPLPPDVLRPQV